MTDAKTPLTAADIEEKWAAKYGSGWFANMGTPIVADDAVFVLAPSKLSLIHIFQHFPIYQYTTSRAFRQVGFWKFLPGKKPPMRYLSLIHI